VKLDALKTGSVVLRAVNSRYGTPQPLLTQIKDAISKSASGCVFRSDRPPIPILVGHFRSVATLVLMFY